MTATEAICRQAPNIRHQTSSQRVVTMKILSLSYLFAVVLLAGCARVTTTTTLHADGSFSRKVVYTVSKNSGMSGGAQQSKDKPEDYFKLPAADHEVNVSRSDTTSGISVTVTREVAADSGPLPDIALLSDAGKVMATSSVSVKKLSGGQIEYVETLHSLEPGKTIEQMVIPDLRARVKKAIPAEYQKSDLIDGLTKEVMMNFVRALV